MTPDRARRPLAPLSADEVAERSSANLDAVCATLGAMAVHGKGARRRAPRAPAPRRSGPRHAGSPGADRAPFQVWTDTDSALRLSRARGMQTRAMAAASAHDDKENRPV